MSWTETYRQGKNIASLGIYMTVSGFVTNLYSYLFVAWLNDRGGTGEVGFFQAGYTLVMQYVGLVFTAMSMEYYPRLSAVCEDKVLLSEHVTRQDTLRTSRNRLRFPLLKKYDLLPSPTGRNSRSTKMPGKA